MRHQDLVIRNKAALVQLALFPQLFVNPVRSGIDIAAVAWRAILINDHDLLLIVVNVYMFFGRIMMRSIHAGPPSLFEFILAARLIKIVLCKPGAGLPAEVDNHWPLDPSTAAASNELSETEQSCHKAGRSECKFSPALARKAVVANVPS